MSDRQCVVCEEQLPPYSGRGRPRKTCSEACRGVNETRRDRATTARNRARPFTGTERKTTWERLMAKVERAPGGCWLWTASLRAGYGQFRIRGSIRGAHVVVYELAIGPVPPGLQLDHLCRVRRCVNPDHVEPVTQQENLARRVWAA